MKWPWHICVLGTRTVFCVHNLFGRRWNAKQRVRQHWTRHKAMGAWVLQWNFSRVSARAEMAEIKVCNI
uniref:Uncharacterized protein n=1 Tax=Picea glauca TaxID=3330 RepID=A0A124GNG1_PICGL|nr:hypothetical protein ABT39_MTgene4726 [Picea glauca]